MYASSEGLQVAVVEHEALGGQAGTSSLIRNYLGFPRGITGAELAFRAFDQAWLFGAELIYGNPAEALSADAGGRIVTLAGGSQITARAIIVACGVSYGVWGCLPEALVGAGVVYGAAVARLAPWRAAGVRDRRRNSAGRDASRALRSGSPS